jgi:uncharacterized lipoprotein YddW (UPF0748 family)
VVKSFSQAAFQRRWKGNIVVFCFGLAVLTVTRAQEFRAAWADVFHNGMRSSAEVDTMVSTLVAGRYNALIVQVLAYMDTNSVAPYTHGAYWKSSILPRTSYVTAGFDPLAYLCQQAHANGIEVHAWMGGSGAAMYRVSLSFPPAGNATLTSHPEWFIAPLANSEGGSPLAVDGNYALDMGSSDVQEYIVSIVRELVTNYPIDGINWDDELNGTGYNAGFGYPARSQTNYARSGLARYRINTGATGTPSNTDIAWSDYRRRFKNELMARVQAEMQSIKTNPRQPLRHTTAALAYSPVPTSCNFTGSVPYTYFCDWAGMLANGWVDAVVPQTYSTSTITNWANLSASCWQYNRNIFPGIGAYLNPDATIANHIRHTRSLGLKGNAIYSYAVPNNSNPSTWWPYVAANVYTNVVSTPPMPWRNPATATEGIVWGRVWDASTGQYVDDATVTVTGGPTVRTDGNGYYVATLVPATAGGTAHSTTASNGGGQPQSSNVVALAGDVVRADFLINVGVPAPPTNLTATALGATQIKLVWSDVATNETGYFVARSTTPGGPYANIAALASNSIVYTNSGLTPATAYYYVVRSTNAVGISANSTAASATTAAPSAPFITSQPQNLTVLVSNNASFSVAATGTAPLSFQWRFNGTPIAGANATSFNLTGVGYPDAGAYSVVVSNSFGSVVSSNAGLAVLSAPPAVRLVNIWNIQAGSRAYVTTGTTERGICLNPVTGHALLVSRAGGLGIYILDADNGAQLGTMNSSGVTSSATFLLNKIDVADDGVVYAGNLTTSSASSPFVIYRWANESAASTIAYSGSPDAGTTARWGDTFSVSGSGVNTRILISGSGATNTVLFTTADGANFTANVINPQTQVPAAEFSRGLFLGAPNTFFVKNRAVTSGNLYTYDVPSHSASLSSSILALDNFMQAIALAPTYNLLAGVVDDNSINNSGHSLKVYDISSSTSPTVVSNFNFLTFGSGTNSTNLNFGGAVDTAGTRIVALDTQNGVVALQIQVLYPAPRITGFSLLPADQRRFQLNMDPGNFVMQASSDLSNWIDRAVTRTNGFFEVTDPVTNSVRYYRTKQ